MDADQIANAEQQSAGANDIGIVQFDRRQSAAIAERRNAVVSAGAGSGKTAVLSERYCRLVRDEHIAVDRILTLTFTRKAAAEMHERIYKRLADLDDELVQEQLARFDRAEISTLDSFCGRVARTRSALFGVAPSFTVDERENLRLARRIALRFLGANAADPVLSGYIAANGFNSVLERGLVRLATNEVTVARPLEFDAMFSRQARRLLNAAAVHLQRLEALRAALLELAAEGDRWLLQLQEALASLSLPNAEALRALGDEFLGETAQEHGNEGQEQYRDRDRAEAGSREERARAAADQLSPAIAFMDGLDLRRGSRSKEGVLAAREQVKDARVTLLEPLRSIRFTLRSLPEHQRLFELLDAFQEQVLQARRQSGVLSYQDVMVMAVELLRREPELRAYYKQQFDQIMIDEFQDNNRLQKELLYLLAERPECCSSAIPAASELETDKLFFVGDAKQSIYRFRGADVGVFRNLAAELPAHAGAALALEANYRSHPHMVRFFNRVFAAVFPEPTAAFEPEFAPIEPQAEYMHPEPEAARPSVTLAWYESDLEPAGGETGEGGGEEAGEKAGEEPAEAAAQQAYHVAQYIASAVEQGTLQISTRDGVRPARYEDFAILLRSTGNQMQFERMLRLFNVPYTAGGMRSLFLDAPAHDLYSILQLCVHPEDREAYAAVLRSPYVALSDHGMLEVLLAEAAPFSEHRFAAEQDQMRYEDAARRYFELCSLADRVPVEELVRIVWIEHGYRYSLLRNPAYHSYLEYYRYLFELAATPTGQTLEEYLASLRENLGQFKRLSALEILHEDQIGVRIMTIHAAKGLEFPVVILADAGNVGSGERAGGEPYYSSAEYGICLNLKPDAGLDGVEEQAANYFYLEGREEADRQEDAEARRLLYVALTRAETHLLLSGVLHSRNRSADSCHLAMVMAALGIDPAAPDASAVPPDLPVRLLAEVIAPVAERELRESGRDDGRGVGPALPADEDVCVAREPVCYEYAATELNRLFGLLGSFAPTGAQDQRDDQAERGEDGEPNDRAGTSDRAGHGRRQAGRTEPLASDPLLGSSARRTGFGTLVHRIIEYRIIERRSGAHPAEDAGAYHALLPPELLGELTAEEARQLLEDGLGLALGFERSELGAELARTGAFESELAFTMPLPGLPASAWVHGQIDLLVHSPAGPGMVIDFKTDTELRIEDYLLQLAIYRDAAGSLTRSAVRCMLFDLRAGRPLEPQRLPSVAAAVASLRAAGLL